MKKKTVMLQQSEFKKRDKLSILCVLIKHVQPLNEKNNNKSIKDQVGKLLCATQAHVCGKKLKKKTKTLLYYLVGNFLLPN